MWRSAFLNLSTNRLVRQFATGNAIARKLASRFVAGERLDQAVAAAQDIRRRGGAVEIDYLGESVRSRSEAMVAREAYLRLLRRLAESGVEAHVSVKLTQMGLDVDEALCSESLRAIAAEAERVAGFLWLDMESSAYTGRTLAAYHDLRARYPNVGIALQAYLRRTGDDLRRVLAMGGTVRLCKGAYSEPESIAFGSKDLVDRNFAYLSEVLLSSGTFQAIATHDHVMISHVKQFARGRDICPKMYEFQMLFGVRRDLQEQLLREGYGVRIYVPYGEEWYPYFMRRLAERPANLLFFLGSLVKEARRSKSPGPRDAASAQHQETAASSEQKDAA